MMADIDHEHYQICRHEATHAVLAWVSGNRLRLVTVSGPPEPLIAAPDQTTRFYCSSIDGDVAELMRRTINAAQMAQTMGPSVLEVLEGRDVASTADSVGFLKAIIPTPEAKRLAAIGEEILAEHQGDEEAIAAAFTAAVLPEVRPIVERPEVLHAVEVLATRLYKESRVYGRDAVATIQEAWREAGAAVPAEALPIEEHYRPAAQMTLAEELDQACVLIGRAFDLLHDSAARYPSSAAAEKMKQSCFRCLFEIAAAAGLGD